MTESNRIGGNYYLSATAARPALPRFAAALALAGRALGGSFSRIWALWSVRHAPFATCASELTLASWCLRDGLKRSP